MNPKILIVLMIVGIVVMGVPMYSFDTSIPDNKPKSSLIDTTATKEGKPQTTCPVLGGDINKDLYVVFKGKRIYVCCSDCIEVIKKNPEKYIKKLEAQGVVLENTPLNKTSEEGTTEKKKIEHSWTSEKCFPKNQQ